MTFNKRHKRSGHLFQNRYKSVVCEEDAYLLELIRYIHLNPLRASLVQSLQELDKYPWAGHATILGRRKNPLLPVIKDPKSNIKNQKAANQIGNPNSAKEATPSAKGGLPFSFSSGKGKKQQNNPENPVNPVKNEKVLAEKTIEDVLLRFDETKRVAMKRYREFMEKGIKQGTREELQGGGLVRSAGGETAGLLGRKAEEREKGDARILGSGDFVENVLTKSDKIEGYKFVRTVSLPELVDKVTTYLVADKNEVLCGSRKEKNWKARALISFVASRNMGYKFNDIAEILGIHPVTAGRCAEKGKKLIDNDKGIWDILR